MTNFMQHAANAIARATKTTTRRRRGVWTTSPSSPDGLVVTDSDSRGDVLGRRRADTIDVNNGGHHEQ